MPPRPLRRAGEALHLLVRHAADLRSAAALVGAYAATVRDPRSRREVRFRLRLGGRTAPVAMRAGDLYTLAEVFHERQYAVADELPAEPLVVDAGANVGLSALWFLARRPGAQILCFEPEPENLRWLRANVGGEPGVTVEAAALGASAGTAVLHLAEHGALHSLHAPEETCRDGGAGPPLAGAPPQPAGDAGSGTAGHTGPGATRSAFRSSSPDHTLEVPRLALGPYLAERGIERVDLLKLDVEGAELEVLAGLGERLWRVERVAGEAHRPWVDRRRLAAALAAGGLQLDEWRVFPSSAGLGVAFFVARRRPATEPEVTDGAGGGSIS